MSHLFDAPIQLSITARMHFMDMVKLLPGPHVWTLTGTPSPSNGEPRTCGMARITVNTGEIPPPPP